MQGTKRHAADVDNPIYARVDIPGRQAVPRRRTAPPLQKTIHYSTPPDVDTDAPVRVVVRHQGRARDWLFPVGVAAILLVTGYLLFTGWVLPSLNHLQSQWHEGDARIGYQHLTIRGVPRDLVAIGYHGRMVVILLATPQDRNSHAVEYVAPQYFPDGVSRALVVQVQDVNHDGYPDLIIETSEATSAQSVAPILYGQPGGGFAWTPPTSKG